MANRIILALLLATLAASQTQAQTNPLWREEKVKNYLPHMTSPEVRDLLTRTDMALIWYTPILGDRKNYGNWSFLKDGATPRNGAIENWFELLDSWFDVADDQGGINGYRP